VHGIPLFFHIFIILLQGKNVNKKKIFSLSKAVKVYCLAQERIFRENFKKFVHFAYVIFLQNVVK